MQNECDIGFIRGGVMKGESTHKIESILYVYMSIIMSIIMSFMSIMSIIYYIILDNLLQ